MITVSLEEKEFKITTELLTKKYNLNLNSKDFNEITSDFINPDNKKTFIEDKPIEQDECFDFNIYQTIQTRIKGEYFLENIELNDLFEFDYNKIFYFLNKDNICTIDKSALKIIREIQDKYNIIKDLYDYKIFVLDFNKLDYENPLEICKEIIYYDICRKDLETKRISEYPRDEQNKVKKAIEMFHKAYKDRYEIAKLKQKSYNFQSIPDPKIIPLNIDDIEQLVTQQKPIPDINDIKINPLNLNLSIYEIHDLEINGNEFHYDDFLVYNGEKFKIVDDVETRDNKERTMYEIMSLIIDAEDIDIYSIDKTRDYDILYFIYLQFIKFYNIITEYFRLTNQIVEDIKKLQLENYNFSFFQNDNGLELLKKNYDDYILQFYNFIIGENGKDPKRTNESRILLENDKMIDDYQNNISNIEIHNKITNIYKPVNIKDIYIKQNFYFTLFFQDTITKPLNIDYINPLGYYKNPEEQVDLNDEYFYKTYHQVYLLSSFHNSKIFNDMKKDLLHLNFKIDFNNKRIIFLNQNEEEEFTDEYFYFYRDNINIKDMDNSLIKPNYDYKLYIFNDTYDKLIHYYKMIHGDQGGYKYKNKEYKEYFNNYKEKFLLVYDDELFNQKSQKEYQLLKNILNLISKDKTTGFLSVSDKVKEFDNYDKSDQNKKNNFETKLKDLYASGLKLLDFYYSTLSNEEQFNKNLEEKINEYKKKYEQETENQALEYKIGGYEQQEIKDGYGYYSEGTYEQQEIFIQTIKTFIYILFDLIINRIFINQNFIYSEFVKKISDIYFGIFNLMFFDSDKKKINQYKKLLEYYLSYYQVKDKIYEYNDEKFKTLKDLNDKSNIIIDALIGSFVFLISEKYLTYGINNESIKAIKIITDAYIYYYSLYEENVVINGQTIIINDGNKDIYYEYQNLITIREKLTQEIKDLFKDLNDDPKETIKDQIQIKINEYNKIKDQITEKENELLNPDVIKQKKEKGFKKVIIENNKDFKEEIKKKYINPFINLIEQMLKNDKIIKDEKIKKLLSDKKNYFDDLINSDNINSQIFKDSLNDFYNYKNLRINQHLTNKEVIQYGINESLTSSLIELIKSQQIKKGDYFLISKNKRVKDAYIYLLNDYIDGENEFKVKINNIDDFIDLLDASNIEKNKENYDIYNFVIKYQNNTGTLKAKLNELTINGFKNNQLLGKYKLMQKQ